MRNEEKKPREKKNRKNLHESIAFYSDDNKGVPMYRLFNPNATGVKQAGPHHYTKDAGERDYLMAIGWNYEGISRYGM